MLHEKHAVATWNLESSFNIFLRAEENQETCVEMSGRDNRAVIYCWFHQDDHSWLRAPSESCLFVRSKNTYVL
jgi:hypothetical protein